MDTNQISCVLLDKLREHPDFSFIGVYAADQIPKIIDCYPVSLIANIDPISLPGQHWVAFYLRSQNDFEFFDSFALPISIYTHLSHSLTGACTHYCTYPIQSMRSTLCGQYCIYFLLNRARGQSFSNILASFCPTNSYINDSLIRVFSSNEFHTLPMPKCGAQNCQCRSQFCSCNI